MKGPSCIVPDLAEGRILVQWSHVMVRTCIESRSIPTDIIGCIYNAHEKSASSFISPIHVLMNIPQWWLPTIVEILDDNTTLFELEWVNLITIRFIRNNVISWSNNTNILVCMLKGFTIWRPTWYARGHLFVYTSSIESEIVAKYAERSGEGFARI